MAIKVGDRMPAGTFKVMTKDGPADLTSDVLFKGKTVVLFSVPGAFTPTCDAKHLPGFVDKAGDFKAKGVDTIAWVPDGALHRIELSSLPAANAGRYLAEEGPLLVRLTAERDLLPLERIGPPGNGLFAVGDVDFDAGVAG